MIGEEQTMKRWQCVFLAALAFLAGCGTKPASDPNGRTAAQWVLSRDGTVVPVGTNAVLKKGVALPEREIPIQKIDLNQKGVTDAELEKLDGLTNLTVLGLHSAKITPRGLERIVNLRTIEELELSYTPLNDEGLEKLKSLPKLKKLFIHGTRVTKEALERFRSEKPGVQVFN